MKINSENLWKYINELGANEKVKLNVYFNEQYVTQIYWNGFSFEWEPGRFTSEAFFNPLYDFVVVEQKKRIPEKLFFTHISNYNDQSIVNNNFNNYFKETQETINQLIDYLKSKGE